MISILLAEDDPTCRQSMQTVLEKEGHAVEAVADGESALQAVAAGHFDLIVCDYRMPGRTGLEVLAAIRQSGSRAAVVMISAYADADTESAARSLGVLGVLKKPFRRQELLILAARAVAS